MNLAGLDMAWFPCDTPADLLKFKAGGGSIHGSAFKG